MTVVTTNGFNPFLTNVGSNETDPKSDFATYGGEWELMLYLKESMSFKPKQVTSKCQYFNCFDCISKVGQGFWQWCLGLQEKWDLDWCNW